MANSRKGGAEKLLYGHVAKSVSAQTHSPLALTNSLTEAAYRVQYCNLLLCGTVVPSRWPFLRRLCLIITPVKPQPSVVITRGWLERVGALPVSAANLPRKFMQELANPQWEEKNRREKNFYSYKPLS